METPSCSREEAQAGRAWLLVDAKGQTVGRLASQIARILQGKHKAIYTSHVDTGDFVVVINGEQAVFTGSKEEKKRYYHHTGYIGGIIERNPKTLRESKPEAILRKAVHGMLPKGTLGREMFRKLKIYRGDNHPHAAQQPKPVAW